MSTVINDPTTPSGNNFYPFLRQPRINDVALPQDAILDALLYTEDIAELATARGLSGGRVRLTFFLGDAGGEIVTEVAGAGTYVVRDARGMSAGMVTVGGGVDIFLQYATGIAVADGRLVPAACLPSPASTQFLGFSVDDAFVGGDLLIVGGRGTRLELTDANELRVNFPGELLAEAQSCVDEGLVPVAARALRTINTRSGVDGRFVMIPDTRNNVRPPLRIETANNALRLSVE